METRQAGHVGRDMKQNSDEITIDLLDVCGVIRAHIKTILLSTIICGVIAYLGTSFLIVPKYKAEAKLYVLSQSSDSEQLTTNDVAVGTSLVSDFAQVVKGQPVLNKVISNLGLNMSYDSRVLHHKAASSYLHRSIHREWSGRGKAVHNKC